MAPNRPFLSTLLASFTARSATRGAITTTASSLTASSAATAQIQTDSATSTTSTTTSSASAPTQRSLTTKANQSQSTPSTLPTTTTATTTVAIQTSTFAASRHHHHNHASPLSLSPSATTSPRGPSATAFATTAAAIPLGATPRGRRGSDSSNEGFRDNLGASPAEKWYIGGRTAAGEERLYRLGMAKRPRSIDRLSLDRLSL